jgi:hypothetical protein
VETTSFAYDELDRQTQRIEAYGVTGVPDLPATMR